MPALPAHGEVAAGDGGGWQRGTFSPAGSRGIYARKTDGTLHMLAMWDSRHDIMISTDAGKDYYRHNRMEFIVNVPAILCRDLGEHGYVKCTIGHVVGGPAVTEFIPFDITIQDLEENLANVKQRVLAKIMAILNARVRVEPDGLCLLYTSDAADE